MKLPLLLFLLLSLSQSLFSQADSLVPNKKTEVYLSLGLIEFEGVLGFIKHNGNRQYRISIGGGSSNNNIYNLQDLDLIQIYDSLVIYRKRNELNGSYNLRLGYGWAWKNTNFVRHYFAGDLIFGTSTRTDSYTYLSHQYPGEELSPQWIANYSGPTGEEIGQRRTHFLRYGLSAVVGADWILVKRLVLGINLSMDFVVVDKIGSKIDLDSDGSLQQNDLPNLSFSFDEQLRLKVGWQF